MPRLGNFTDILVTILDQLQRVKFDGVTPWDITDKAHRVILCLCTVSSNWNNCFPNSSEARNDQINYNIIKNMKFKNLPSLIQIILEKRPRHY